MAGRIRTLKPEWLEDEKLGNAGDAARVLSVGLILLADDHGRGRASIAALAAAVWAQELSRDPRETLAKASRAFDALVAMPYVRAYEVSGQSYYAIVNWTRHQRVDKPGKPHVPPPPEVFAGPSRESRETLAPDRDLDLDQDQDLERDPRARAIPVPTDTTTDTTTPQNGVAAALAALFPDLALDVEGLLSEWTSTYPGLDLVQLAREAKAQARANHRKVDRAASLLGRWYQRAWHERRAEAEKPDIEVAARAKRLAAEEEKFRAMYPPFDAPRPNVDRGEGPDPRLLTVPALLVGDDEDL